MLHNYLKTALRILLTNRIFSMINIFGLAIGLSVFILISLYVAKEYSYDKQWENSDRIARLNMELRPDSLDPVTNSLTSYLIMPQLQQYFSSEIELSARRVYRGRSVKVGENSYPGGMWLYEREFIDIFKFDLISGSIEEAMASPDRIALSETLALKYFGLEDPLGKTLSLEVPGIDPVDYLVAAVYRLPAGDSSLHFPSIALFEEGAMTERSEALKSWGPEGWFVMNYFLLKPEVDITNMNSRMEEFMARHVGPAPNADNFNLALQKLTDIHFKPNRGEQGGDTTQVTIFSVIGILVLLVGSINFVVLTTANSINRRHEVGVRKAAGANTNQLVSQFLGESLLFTFIALMIALMLVELSLPFFANLIGQELTIYYPTLANFIFVMCLMVLVGGLAGLYPALVLAHSMPSGMLKEENNIVGSISVRNLLVGFQFSISIFLLIATLVLYAQLAFYQNHDRGFNPENLLAIERPDVFQEQGLRMTAMLVDEIEKLPGVESVTLSMNQPNDSISNLPAIPISRELNDSGDVNSMGLFVWYDFFKVYEIPLLAGRTYDSLLDNNDVSPADRKIVINRFAASALGFKSPEDAIGKQISYGVIIGVVENSQFLSTRKEASAEIYPLIPADIITVRFQDSIVSSVTQDIESVWRSIVGDKAFNSNFVAQNLQAEFTQEENEGKLLLTLSVLAIFVSSSGLFGLVAFAVKRQVKEVGIRKVLGAEFSSILKLFVWQFIKPVLLANIIACPLALWAMLSWLQRFPYQIGYAALLPLCLIAGFVALLIASITVAGTVTKSANAKPVLALRYE